MIIDIPVTPAAAILFKIGTKYNIVRVSPDGTWTVLTPARVQWESLTWWQKLIIPSPENP